MDIQQLVPILEACKRGEESAREKFYRHFYGYALSICLAYANHSEEAAEIMNDGFVKVFRHLSGQRHPEALTAWIRKIMVNTAIDHYRKQSRLPVSQSLHALQQVASVDYGEEAVYGRLSVQEIMAAVQALPVPYRLVFNLYVLEGYAHKEIAERLRIAESTSRAHLSEANAMLRKAITPKKKDATI